MKRIKIFCIAAAFAAVLLSCRKEGDAPSEPEFKAVMEVIQNDSPDTRTTIDGSSVKWEEGDQIRINDVCYQAASGGATTTTFLRLGSSAPATTPYKAIYPYLGSACSPCVVDLASSVTEPVSSFPMYAESSTGTLQFKNLCGLVSLKLKTSSGTATVHSIVLRDAAASPLGMSGSCTISADGDAWKAVPTDNSSFIALNCSKEINSSSSESFVVAVPPASYSALKIVINTDKGTVTKTAKTAIEVLRSKLTTISLTLSLPGEYQAIDLGLPDGLLWASRNVGAGSDTAATKFTFAEASMASSAGDGWRLPTKAEIAALTSNTYLQWDADANGYYVYKAKLESDKGKMNDPDIASYYSSSDTRIFLPAAFSSNQGFYWSSDFSDMDNAYVLFFNSTSEVNPGDKTRAITYSSCVRLVKNPS